MLRLSNTLSPTFVNMPVSTVKKEPHGLFQLVSILQPTNSISHKKMDQPRRSTLTNLSLLSNPARVTERVQRLVSEWVTKSTCSSSTFQRLNQLTSEEKVVVVPVLLELTLLSLLVSGTRLAKCQTANFKTLETVTI